MEEAIHNVLCLQPPITTPQEHLPEEACDGLELIWVKLILQDTLVYQITDEAATVVIEMGVHQVTQLQKSKWELAVAQACTFHMSTCTCVCVRACVCVCVHVCACVYVHVCVCMHTLYGTSLLSTPSHGCCPVIMRTMLHVTLHTSAAHA